MIPPSSVRKIPVLQNVTKRNWHKRTASVSKKNHYWTGYKHLTDTVSLYHLKCFTVVWNSVAGCCYRSNHQILAGAVCGNSRYKPTMLLHHTGRKTDQTHHHGHAIHQGAPCHHRKDKAAFPHPLRLRSRQRQTIPCIPHKPPENLLRT